MRIYKSKSSKKLFFLKNRLKALLDRVSGDWISIERSGVSTSLMKLAFFCEMKKN